MKYKVRIYVQGDLQDLGDEMIYSVTLIVYSFRAIIVLVAYYDLEYKQYDIVNIFLNSDLDKGNNKGRVYCWLLDGYKELGFL